MTDRDSFLAAIRAEPADDLRRLAYADWLDDHATTDAERGQAELIRVQVQLSKWTCEVNGGGGNPWNHVCGTDESGYWLCQPLRSRERVLRERHETAWRAGPRCERRWGGVFTAGLDWDNFALECPDFGGSGDAGGLLRLFDYDTSPRIRTRSFEPVRIEWDRGFIGRVCVPRLSDVVEYPGGEMTYGRRPPEPTPLLRQLRTPTPYRCLAEIVPLDREPMVDAAGHYGWVRANTGEPSPAQSVIPESLFLLLESYLVNGGHILPPVRNWTMRWYPTRAAAVAALGRAVAGFGTGD